MMANRLEANAEKREREGTRSGWRGKLERVDIGRGWNGRERAGWYCKWLRILYNWERTLADWAGRAWNFWCSRGQIWISESFQRNSVGSRTGRGGCDGIERRRGAEETGGGQGWCCTRCSAWNTAATLRNCWETDKLRNGQTTIWTDTRISISKRCHACIVSNHQDEILLLWLQLNFTSTLFL